MLLHGDSSTLAGESKLSANISCGPPHIKTEAEWMCCPLAGSSVRDVDGVGVRACAMCEHVYVSGGININVCFVGMHKKLKNVKERKRL